MSPVNSPDISKLTAEQKRVLLAQLMQQQAAQLAPSHTAPLSFAQQRLWFIDQLQPGQTVYTIPAALRLQGQLQVDVLQRCLDEIIARHEVLRTRFVVAEGEPVQKAVLQQKIELSVIEIADISSESAVESAEVELAASDSVLSQLRPYLQSLVAKPFDLATGPLLRAQLIKLSEHDYVLAVTVHHIVADYWSLKVLMKEIALLYQAFSHQQPSPLPELPIQYGDYAQWQRDQQSASEKETQFNYWLTKLAEPPAVLQLPTDYSRPAVQRFRGARHRFSLSLALSDALASLAQRSQATLFMTLLAAFNVLLYRYSNQADILVGSTVSNRDRTEIKELIGLFVNNLVFRSTLSAEYSFEQLLQQVKETALAAYGHKDIPFEQIVDALQIDRQLSHNALFQVMFILHNTPTSSFSLPSLTVSALDLDNSAARFDLSLDMYENESGLTGVFEYSTDLFKPSTIARLCGHFTTLLQEIVATPDAAIGSLPMLALAEVQSLDQWNKTAVEIPHQCAHEIIEAQTEKTPEAIALLVDPVLADYSSQVLLPEQPWTYRLLNARANQLAHYLKTQGVSTGERIAIAINRSAELVVAMLAVLKLGSAYIPLDPTHPESRLQYVLSDAGVSLVLESDASLGGLASNCSTLDIKCLAQDIDQQSTENLSISVSPDDLAYIIYTSGSTGQPKGVPIRHRSLANLLAAMANAPGIETEDVFLAVTTVAFDIATLELLLPLTVGARLAIASAETVRDSDRMIAQLESGEITLMQATPATWRMLLDSGWRGWANLKILCGGEALGLALARQLLSCGKELWNLYGPTETTIWSAAIQLNAEILDKGFVPIGSPIDNTTFHILDQQQQLVPMGVPGELYIGGLGLSSAYLNRPALTAERFISHRGETLYKTGDLVRRHASNTLEYMGRLDHQIKLRGYRIELGEIEAVLNQHDDVEQSVVVLRTSESGEPQLTAYCKVWPDVELGVNPINLQQDIGKRLPAYMLPTAYVLLSDFPLTPNGKIDRKALPEPRENHSNTELVLPQTPTEQIVATIWAEVLGVSTVSTTENFFEIGGHSLLAARMIARLQPVFNVSIPLSALFAAPTLSAFAATIDTTLQGNDFAPVQAVDRAQPLPLSYAQQRQWVLSQLEPDSGFYNIPAAVRLEGALSLPRLEETLAFLCDRHEELRTVFISDDGKAKLEILPAVTPVVSFVDARESMLSELQVKARLAAAAREPFDLGMAPLMRVEIVRTAKQTYFVLLVLHHIIADADSINILLREMVSAYNQLLENTTVALPALPLQYVDYARWQQRLDTTHQLEYWKAQLQSLPPLLALPTDYVRPATQQFEGDSYRFTLTSQQTEAVRQLAQQHSATLFMTLMAVFQSLLHRYSTGADGGAESLVVGTPIESRPQASLENVLGMFVNTLVLRGDFSKEITFAEFLAQIRSTAIAAYANQDIPFEQLLDVLDVPRNWSHSPLFQVMFIWRAAKPTRSKQNASNSAESSHLLNWQPVQLDNNTTKVDLTLSMSEETAAEGAYISGKFEYRKDLFKAGTIERMADAFCTLLDAVVKTPDRPIQQLSLVSNRQKKQLKLWNDTSRSYPSELCLHQLFEQQMERSPEAPALITSTHTLSYRELDAKANRLAGQLQTLKLSPDSRVGICLDRSANLIIAILAVLKAGAAYVPLDTCYPSDRLTYILEDAQVSVVITQSDYETLVKRDARTILLDSQELPTASDYLVSSIETTHNNLAYIIYTSGSTGKPKGVAIEHRSPVALVQWVIDTYSPAQLSGVLAATSVCFDLSIFEIFVPLSCGGCVILSENVLQLPELIAADKVTLINTVPTAVAELIRINGIPSSVSTINLAGEPIPSSLVKQLYAVESVQQVFNLYGPSEDTTYSTHTLLSLAETERGLTVPIGRPIAGTQAYVLDNQKSLVPIGMPGELYLAGDGLAREYWNRPALTKERFVDCDFAVDEAVDKTVDKKTSVTLYKTGDLARYRPDGQLEFLGRIDQQVKIRGFRIELGEIESVLLQSSQVVQSAVTVWNDERNNRRLVAYIVLANMPSDVSLGKALLLTSDIFAEVQSLLQASLPDYMIPTIIVPLQALPLLPNGKINRTALPDPLFEAIPVAEPLSSSETELSTTERTLVNIWQNLLNQPVGLHDNFFELGGDSILAIQAIAQAQRSGLYFSPRDLFQYSTVSQLATVVKSKAHSQVQQEPVVGVVPLAPIQHWFFSQDLINPHHWNQSILLSVKQGLQPEILARSLQHLINHNDALRATFHRTEQGWQQRYKDHIESVPLEVVQCAVEDAASAITAKAEDIQSSFRLDSGPLLKAVYYDLETTGGREQRLLLACHHLVIDGVSWRILLSDLQMLYQQLSQSPDRKDVALLPPKTLSCRDWVSQLKGADFTAELPYWKRVATASVATLPLDFSDGENKMSAASTISVSLSLSQTKELLKDVPAAYSIHVDELLLTALALTLLPAMSSDQLAIRIFLESHGRSEDHDLSHTVGWLTSLYPVLLSISSKTGGSITNLSAAIKTVKETLRVVPNQGRGYGALRYLHPKTEIKTAVETDSPVRFNYLGQTDQLFAQSDWLAPASESTGPARSPQDLRDVLLEINAVVSRQQLSLYWTYSEALHKYDTIASWATSYLNHLTALIQHCLSTDTDHGYSPTDFPQMDLEQGELDSLLASLGGDVS
ncbi:MAG: amino acid adenylation domain-containing protein [Phormidesmis sp.]